MHRFWDCAVSACQSAAAIDVGGCERCRQMYCAAHITSEQHTCEKTPLDEETWLAAQTTELTALAKKLNEKALIDRAQQLSGGKACHLDTNDTLGRNMMGGMHVHRELIFDDGTVWLVRMLRETYTSFDEATCNQILLSECATLAWLAEHVDGVPAPRLHGYGLRGDTNNAVGVAYMLIDKLAGVPFLREAATAEQTAKVLDQWAGMLCALGKHPLDKLGSLTFEADGRLAVGPVASDRCGSLPCTLGPFTDARSFYTAWADTYLDKIYDGQLFSANAVDAYLMIRWVKEQVANGPWASPTEAFHAGPFFLCHADDKGDHLLVDDDYNITGVIDWTFARTAPAYEAFGPALVTANNGDLFLGKPGLSKEDRVLQQALLRRHAPYCFFDADPMRRMLLWIGVGFGFSSQEMVDVFRCLAATLSDQQAVPEWSAWRTQLLAQWKQEARLAALLPTPRFTTCAISGCGRPGVHGSSCEVCKRHLCALHCRPNHHLCQRVKLHELDESEWEQRITDEVEALLAQVNIPALELRASTLRGGIACTFRRGQHLGAASTMGCANYHSWLDFADGKQWVVRLPLTTDGGDLPTDLLDHLVASEYATLRFLEKTAVPAPRAHGFGLLGDADNAVGVAYLLEDALPGRPFRAHEATPAQKDHVYRQYSDILAEISKHPVKQACSLVPDGDDVKEGAIASDRFITLSQHGPYTDALSFYVSVADQHMALIADGQVFVDYPREAFVFYRLLRDRAAPVLASASEADQDTLPGFFLKHVDDKGDHVLVDEDYNITGLIDWQFARFVPALDAFGPSLITADMTNMYDGKAGLSTDDERMSAFFRESGRDDLARLAGGSELARRFHFGLASRLTKDEALTMMGAALTLLGDGNCDAERWATEEWEKGKLDLRCRRIDSLLNEGT